MIDTNSSGCPKGTVPFLLTSGLEMPHFLAFYSSWWAAWEPVFLLSYTCVQYIGNLWKVLNQLSAHANN